MQNVLEHNPPVSPHISPTISSQRLHQIGYWSLLLLVFELPFELTQHHFFDSDVLVISNLSLSLYITLGLGALSLCSAGIAFVKGLVKGKLDTTNFFYRHRLALLLFGALLIAATISSLLAKEATSQGEGLKWTAQLATDALLWLATVFWLESRSRQQIQRIGLMLVAGATIAAFVGLLEFALGTGFAESLDGWFKVKPTMAGPYLRLSGTFEYANIAAIYFELALPFALAGLLSGLTTWHIWRLAGWAVAIVILLEALLLTLSRGAWFGLSVGLMAMGVVLGKKRWVGHWWMMVGATGGVGLLLVLLAIVFVPQFSLRLNAQSDQDWYRASYFGPPPAVMTVCQNVNVAVQVQNPGPLTWQAQGAKPYNLSYHWLDASGHIAEFEGIRSGLGSDLLPGKSQLVQAALEAPLEPGQYFLVWDMVQEDVSWFALKAPTPTRLPVQVEDLPPEQKAVACNTPQAQAAMREVSPLAELPQVLEQPNRIVLWKAALSMLAAHPMWGVGPNGYKLNYGLFTTPPMSNWDKRIYANNLFLEILTDLGLVGGGLFGALVVVLMWPLLSILKQKLSLDWWQVATLGALTAFFAHGLVDYFLGSHPIHILFWILLALAASAKPKSLGQNLERKS